MVTTSFTHPQLFCRAGKSAKNKTVLAPLTHNMSEDNGDLSSDEMAWLSLCARGGFGTLILAATQVQTGGRCWQGQPGLMSDHQQGQFAKVAAMARGHEVLTLVQLHHGGVRASVELNSRAPMGPSAIPPGGRYPLGVQEMSGEQIAELKEAFVHSALRAFEAGLDGIELHGAHNFLLCNFLNPTLNQRSDEWGGSVYKRTKLLRDIIAEIRRRLPRNFIVGVRLSPESYANVRGIALSHQMEVANILAEQDIDYLHFSMGDSFKAPNEGEGSSLLANIRQGFIGDIPLMVAGKIADGLSAQQALHLGADMVAVGSAALGNPDWFNRVSTRTKLINPPFSRKRLSLNGFNAKGLEYLLSVPGLVATPDDIQA
ncbi:NADH:flavin oxidoreductase [Shewanella rhizosphaerae]|uniref:NADH:flavin oxidoreductase n=1 Tax=Shewanella rhizosphaerae TaxID=2864207 RepID=UPI001C65FD72|nr:NADH:flavin oxidoreductase [Shewanella rhizosphaerae]QYK12159.1 NADH:flavin oxidoreductase [Shewanella rhizosphaerae]